MHRPPAHACGRYGAGPFILTPKRFGTHRLPFRPPIPSPSRQGACPGPVRATAGAWPAAAHPLGGRVRGRKLKEETAVGRSMGRASSSKHAVVALRSPHGAGQHRHQQQHQQPGSPSISIASPASSASSSSSSSSSSSAQAPSPRVSLAAALSCRHCGKGETWGLHQLPAETLAYSRWSDSNNRGYLMYVRTYARHWPSRERFG